MNCFYEKFTNFVINLNELLKFEALTSKSDTTFLQIFRQIDQNWCEGRRNQ